MTRNDIVLVGELNLTKRKKKRPNAIRKSIMAQQKWQYQKSEWNNNNSTNFFDEHTQKNKEKHITTAERKKNAPANDDHNDNNGAYTNKQIQDI